MSILEEVLLEEYDRSCRLSRALEAELAELPKGSIRERVINGRIYYYLQYRDGVQVKSDYVRSSEVEELRRMIARRKELVKALKEQASAQSQIERALGRRFVREHARESSLKTNLGVTAQSLRHMELLLRDTQTVLYKGMQVTIPAPEAYAVHKMVVNHERKKKQEKDAAAIVGLWPFLDYDVVAEMIEGLTKKERARVEAFMQTHLLELPR